MVILISQDISNKQIESLIIVELFVLYGRIKKKNHKLKVINYLKTCVIWFHQKFCVSYGLAKK